MGERGIPATVAAWRGHRAPKRAGHSIREADDDSERFAGQVPFRWTRSAVSPLMER